jgi:type III pantothenate kinase
MLLAVDVGNTQTKLGVFRQEKLMHEWRASTDARRTADELALMFGEFLSVAELSFSHEITGVAISSVVPSATQQLREMTLRYFGFHPVVVEPGVRTGIAVATDNPREVGADRIANAVAARDMFPDCSAVVVDLGTAIKVIGRSTVTSIQSGVVYGAAALVDGLLERVLDELGEDAGVVATGGLGPTVVRHCRDVQRLEPALTLLGLRLVYERNTTREEE